MVAVLQFFRILFTAEVLKGLLSRVAVWLGMTVVSYIGVGLVMDQVEQQLIANYSGAPALVLQYLAVARVQEAISIILSAYGASLTLKGLTAAGTMKQVLWKPYQQGALFPGL